MERFASMKLISYGNPSKPPLTHLYYSIGFRQPIQVLILDDLTIDPNSSLLDKTAGFSVR